MPNLVPAADTGLPATRPDRRAMMRGLLSAGVAASATAAGAAPPPTPLPAFVPPVVHLDEDPALLEIGEKLPAARAGAAAAAARLAEIEGAAEAAAPRTPASLQTTFEFRRYYDLSFGSVPEELTLRGYRRPPAFDAMGCALPPRHVFTVESINVLLDDPGGPVFPRPRLLRMRRAARAYEAERERLCVESGLRQADEEAGSAREAVSDLCRQAMRTTPRTAAGLLIQANAMLAAIETDRAESRTWSLGHTGTFAASIARLLGPAS